jgi:site-specific DNA-methyltransferase (adenine-specific)
MRQGDRETGDGAISDLSRALGVDFAPDAILGGEPISATLTPETAKNAPDTSSALCESPSSEFPHPPFFTPWTQPIPPRTLPEPAFRDGNITLYQGEMFALLRAMPSGSFNAVVCDPPYSSGGLMRSDRVMKTSDKYVLTGTQQEGHPQFSGDNRDQRAFTFWCTLWMAECLRLVKPGGVLMSFIDWRNGPALSDALQAAGWLWRGRVSWDKTEAARPQKGWFRTGQLEDIMLGTNGPMPSEQLRDGPCLAGIWRGAVNSEPKHHITGKPVALMQWLLSVLPQGSAVLDPFAGSGPTLLACRKLGHSCVGIEEVGEYIEIVKRRFAQGELGLA